MDQDDKKKRRGDTIKKMQDLFDKSMYASVIANGPGESLRKALDAVSFMKLDGVAERLFKAQEAVAFMKVGGGITEQILKAQEAVSMMRSGGFFNQISMAQKAASSLRLGGIAQQLSLAHEAVASIRTSGFAEQLSKAQEAVSGMRLERHTELFEKINQSRIGAISNNMLGLSQRAEWFEAQKESALYSYLATIKTEDSLAFLDLQESLDPASVTLDVSTWEEVSGVQPEIENEIIGLLKSRGDLSQLSLQSKRHLCVIYLLLFLELMSHASALITVGAWVEGIVASAGTSSEVRKRFKGLTGAQKALMEGQCVTTGEQVILRSSFSTDSLELGRMERGMFLDVLKGSKDGWVHVLAEIDGEMVEGWVARRYVVVF